MGHTAGPSPPSVWLSPHGWRQVTDGAAGAELWVRGGEHHAARPAAVGSVVDPVGAGDAFSAALAAGLLRSGLAELGAVLQAACAAGALAVQTKGSTPRV